ncbi:KilA-N domain-containing protein [Methylomagnum ishizawai]|uniref:KilA-N domain-containing protein n=1 Tax=Methylomagnum ishizawai TaxID=1760988 RepID=A0A1Y6D2E6_9GAMM|nr:KilA-N domain-containing protein [Methylomagnum ishizawai]SMF96560.1 KilA-N domain-containing protein [Methylomagnum ishizawai]SMF96985.1 KilA-N domain-containing protein [Methylomagnum ishizawai]
MARSLVEAEYQGVPVGFTEDGWFNATKEAERFGKSPHEWLRLPATREYLEAIERRYGKIPYVRTSKARLDRGGGTWLHPRLAVRFAQWLNVDFAVWCDEQIDAILRGEHAHFDWKRTRSETTSTTKVMREVLRLVRLDEGKTTGPHHYMKEAKLVNWAVSGEFKGLDRGSLALDELALLASLEERNAVLLGRGIGYDDRKKMLEQHALDWRAGHQAKIGRAA